jgi:hypothetical protein
VAEPAGRDAAADGRLREPDARREDHAPRREGRRHVRLAEQQVAIDTAEEVEAGRGLTYTDLHLTEVAYWRDSRKALGLLSAVPDRPGTSIFLESTANGQNWFYDRAKAAATGASEYELVFVGWHEDPDCSRAFSTVEEREEFVATIGRRRGARGSLDDRGG